MSLWKAGIVIGLIWSILAINVFWNLDPDNNPETGEMEIYGGGFVIERFGGNELLLLIIWGPPVFLGSWIFLFIYSIENIIPLTVWQILIFISILISTPIFLGWIGKILEKYIQKRKLD